MAQHCSIRQPGPQLWIIQRPSMQVLIDSRQWYPSEWIVALSIHTALAAPAASVACPGPACSCDRQTTHCGALAYPDVLWRCEVPIFPHHSPGVIAHDTARLTHRREHAGERRLMATHSYGPGSLQRCRTIAEWEPRLRHWLLCGPPDCSGVTGDSGRHRFV